MATQKFTCPKCGSVETGPKYARKVNTVRWCLGCSAQAGKLIARLNERDWAELQRQRVREMEDKKIKRMVSKRQRARIHTANADAKQRERDYMQRRARFKPVLTKVFRVCVNSKTYKRKRMARATAAFMGGSEDLFNVAPELRILTYNEYRALCQREYARRWVASNNYVYVNIHRDHNERVRCCVISLLRALAATLIDYDTDPSLSRARSFFAQRYNEGSSMDQDGWASIMSRHLPPHAEPLRDGLIRDADALCRVYLKSKTLADRDRYPLIDPDAVSGFDAVVVNSV